MKKPHYYTLDQAVFTNYTASIGLLIISAALYLFSSEPIQPNTRFADTEFVHLFLAQFYHLNVKHWLLNSMGLIMITWCWADSLSPASWLVILTSSLLTTPLWLCLVEPIQWYFGLSGALHTLFAVLIVISLSNSTRQPLGSKPKWPLWLMTGGLITKLLLEATSKEHSLNLPMAEQIAFEAHRGGAITGVTVGILLVGFYKRRSKHGIE